MRFRKILQGVISITVEEIINNLIKKVKVDKHYSDEP